MKNGKLEDPLRGQMRSIADLLSNLTTELATAADEVSTVLVIGCLPFDIGVIRYRLHDQEPFECSCECKATTEFADIAS